MICNLLPEWRHNSLTHVQNKIAEYMCKKMNLEYRIIESNKDESRGSV
jgi:hypothetical protein